MLTDHDIYLFREGTHGDLSAKLGCHLLEGGGAAFAVWAPNAAAVSVIGDWNGWGAHADPLAVRADGSGIWEGIGAGRAARAGLQVPHRARSRRLRGRRRPTRSASAAKRRRPPARASGRSSTTGATRDWMARARPAQRARCADVDLRGAPGLVAAQGRRASSTTARSPHELAEYVLRAGLHARRADADHGASVLRLLGLPDHRLLRADRPLRHAAGFHVLRRHLHQHGHRRDPRLGAVALSHRRAWPGRTSTARICTSMPIRARDSIRSGTRPSSTTAATRCAAS